MVGVFHAASAAFADAGLGGGSGLAELIAVLLVLVHLVVRDSLAGHAVYLRFMFEGSTVAPPPGPARCWPLTGQHSCRQPVCAPIRHSDRSCVFSHMGRDNLRGSF